MQALTRRFIISNSISRISHFSSHQSSARRHEDDARNLPVSVWWDFENIHLPATVSPYQVSQRITAALRANGIKGPVQISAYGNISELTRSIQEALSSTGISLIHVPAGRKNGADRLLIIDMMYWVSQHPPPAHLFLISGDSDFAGILHRLRMSNYNILLANGAYVSTALCSAASVVWKWNTLLEGENHAGKRFNQPPDGLAGSWYGNTRLPLESLFPSVDQPAGEVSSECETLRPIPSVVVNKICQILSSHPKGVSITILRQELTNEMILDDDLYGYKKFSLFLSAMPDILRMHPLGAGQYSVCGVNAKAPRSQSTDSSMNSSESSTTNDSDHSTPLTKVEVHDVSSSTNPEDKKSAHSSPVLSSHKKPQDSSQLLGLGSFTKQKMQHPSPAIHVEEPSPVTHSLGPPNSDKYTVGSCVDHLAVNKKQYDSKGDSYFQRIWKRLFGGNDDLAMSIQENNTVIQIPTSPSSPSFDSPPVGKPVKPKPYDGEGHEKSEAYDEGHERRGFFNRIINLFKLDDYETRTVSEASSSEFKENDMFVKDGFWAEIKSFLGTPHGADIVSKSKSRVHIAQTMKNAGPAILRTFEESDILHLVDVLIDDKRWVGECPYSSPFKVISLSGESLSENLNKSSALSSRFILKQQQPDLQKLPKHDGVIKNQKPPGDNKRSSEKTRTRMLGDCRRLLNEVVKEHRQGFPLRGFRKLFAERYCYNLNLEALGFETLASLVKKIPGFTVEGAFVYPSRKPLDATWRSSISDISSDSTRKSAHSGSDSEQTDTSRNYKQPTESHFDELGPVVDLTQTRAKLKGKTEYYGTTSA